MSRSARRARSSRLPFRAAPATAVALACVAAGTVAGPARGQAGREAEATPQRRCRVQRVSPGELEAAIRARSGYDVSATPNQGRFLAELLLDLAEDHRERRPRGPPFVIRHEAFFSAFLRVTGLSRWEAPPGFREADRVGQKIVVEYRTDRVIERVQEGPEPRQALAVRATWPDTGRLPSSFTYRDTASEPEVRVRNARDVTYRLLAYDSVVVYDRVRGISGRPVSGLLGMLFDVVGMTAVRESRFAVAGDGTQVTYTRIGKEAPVDGVATVMPDGRARRGVPDGRPELERLRAVVQRDREVAYAGPPPAACPRPAGR